MNRTMDADGLPESWVEGSGFGGVAAGGDPLVPAALEANRAASSLAFVLMLLPPCLEAVHRGPLRSGDPLVARDRIR